MTTDVNEEKSNIDTDVLEEMLKVGAHFGYSKTRRHPSAAPFVFTTKNRTDILDIEKTYALLTKALEFIEKLAEEDKVILFVGTKPESKKAVKEAAQSIDTPYVSERWIGGTITNFSEIKKRVAELKDLREKREKGELEKYTKKERLDIDEKIKKLERNFGGIVSMTKIPDVLFIVDSKHEHIAVKEAKRVNIPIVSLLNSDCDISEIDYPIVANDAAMSSITFFVDQIISAYKRGKKAKEELKTQT